MTVWNVDELTASLSRALEVPADAAAPEGQLELTQSISWIALSVRRLADTGQLSAELQRRAWPVRLHWPRNGRRPEMAEISRYAEFYELRASRATTMSTMRLCGMVIHSLILAPVVAEDGDPAGFVFNSMLTRDEGLFFLEWRHLAQLVQETCDEAAGSGVISGR